MIKFRCPNCGQKIAVNDEGAGVDISCPNCVRAIVVPPRTSEEFSPRPSMPLQACLSNSEQQQLERVRQAEDRVARSEALMHAGLLPQLARMMMDRLFRAVLSQRAQLMDSQYTATARIVELEERLLRVQQQLQNRLNAYELRIGELERGLATKEEENRELIRINFQLSKRALEAEGARRPGRVDLREAGFLLRA